MLVTFIYFYLLLVAFNYFLLAISTFPIGWCKPLRILLPHTSHLPEYASLSVNNTSYPGLHLPSWSTLYAELLYKKVSYLS